MSSTADPSSGRSAWPDRVGALLRAALALGSDVDLDRVLGRIVESAAQVAGARFAALGVFAVDGTMVRFVHRGVDEQTVAEIGALPRGRGLLGEVILADGPICLENLTTDPRACGFPPGHPPMRTFLGVPIVRGENRYGNLYLTEKVGGVPFNAEDEALVVTLAAFAASALENTHLVEMERARAATLVDLAAAEERDRTRQEMLGLVIAAQEAERARVARDLHDEVGQALTSVLLGLRLVDGALDAERPDLADARGRVEELRTLVADALRESRQLAFELRPTVLDDVGLGPALARLVTDLGERHELRVELVADGLDAAERLPSTIETVVYRIVQESLTNVVRHTCARDVSVVVSRRDDRVRTVIADNGVGFDATRKSRTLGLRGMAERASLVGGRLELTSSPGAGTVVALEVPLA